MSSIDTVPVQDSEKRYQKWKGKARKDHILLATITLLCLTLALTLSYGILHIQSLQKQVQFYKGKGQNKNLLNENNNPVRLNKSKEKPNTRPAIRPSPPLTIEAEQVLLDMKRELGLRHITCDPQAIYRRDLGLHYVAYWEVQFDNKEYIIISASSKTNDRKLVTQGPIPSMTDYVNEIAMAKNEFCMRYLMMTPSGELMCEGKSEKIVATSMDVLATVNTSHLHRTTNLHLDVKTLEMEWLKHGQKIQNSGEWTDQESHGHDGTSQGSGPISETSVMVGEVITIVVGKPSNLKKLGIYYEPDNTDKSQLEIREGQMKLCVCLAICDDTDIYSIQESGIHVNPNTGIGSLQFEVSKNSQYIFNTSDVSFVVEIQCYDGAVIRNHYGFDYESRTRKRRSMSNWEEILIDHENQFPDYDQFRFGNCDVGCGPVAWAMVFGYLDRRSHIDQYMYGSESQALYRSGCDGTTGSDDMMAPASWDCADGRLKSYIGELNQVTATFCLDYDGATPQTEMAKVLDFYKARQTGGLPEVHQRSWEMSGAGVYSDEIAIWARTFLDNGWPVIVGVREAGVGTQPFSQHYPVATRYRIRNKTYRNCYNGACGEWQTGTDIEMFTHQGWGGRKNRWRKMEIFFAITATY